MKDYLYFFPPRGGREECATLTLLRAKVGPDVDGIVPAVGQVDLDHVERVADHPHRAGRSPRRVVGGDEGRGGGGREQEEEEEEKHRRRRRRRRRRRDRAKGAAAGHGSAAAGIGLDGGGTDVPDLRVF